MKDVAGIQSHVIGEITSTLQGAVVDVLAQLVPDVQALPRGRALEMILDDPRLLDRCFQAFRDNPDRFRHLLVNRQKVPVQTAEEILRCGRSLQDVVTILVRTAAKRHFRRRLDGTTRPLRRMAGPGSSSLMGRLRSLVMETPSPRPGKTPGRLLYEAFQDYLRHDWQVALVPEYAALSPVVVRKLGARILDYRVAADIRRLKADPTHPPQPTSMPPLSSLLGGGRPAVPAPEAGPEPSPPPADEGAAAARQGAIVSITGARGASGPADAGAAGRPNAPKEGAARLEDLLTPDGSRLRAGAFSLVLLDPDVRAALPDPGAMLHITEVLSMVGSGAARQLMEGLSLKVDQLAVLLVSANQALGDRTFASVFGNPGRSEVVAKLVSRARALGVGSTTPITVVASLARKGFAVGRPRAAGEAGAD